MPDRLFVYGTLMRGFDNPMALRLAAEATFLGAARCTGQLYLVAHYPGLLLSDDAADVVHGELFELPASGDLMAGLDDYEGCGPTDPHPTAYLRQIVPVTRADGGTIKAWTYVYNRDVVPARRILSGNFHKR